MAGSRTHARGQAVLETLRRQVMMNELPPGTVLTELTLAAQLGCSQGAVREALLRLEGEGLVSRSGHRGTVVTALGAAEAAEILLLRRQIEGRAAPGAAALLTPDGLAGLGLQLDAMRQAAASGAVWDMIVADMAFHLCLFRAAGLAAMEPILTRCILHSQRFRLWAPWHSRKLSVTAERHVPILEAARLRDGTALQRELHLHLDTIVDPDEAAMGTAA